jgi:hypothetical protein
MYFDVLEIDKLKTDECLVIKKGDGTNIGKI